MIRLIEQRANIVFVDEACFTSNQIRARYWAKAGDASLKIDKEKIAFKCIAVVAAIDVQGRVVALLQRDLSIKTSDFVDFLVATVLPKSSHNKKLITSAAMLRCNLG